MKKIIFTSVLISLFVTGIMAQIVSHPLANRLMFNVGGKATYASSDFQKPQLGYIGNGSLTYFFFDYDRHIIGASGFGGYGIIKGQNEHVIPGIPSEFKTDFFYFGGGLVYSYAVSDSFFPYFSLGAEYMFFEPKDSTGNLLPGNAMGIYKKNDFFINSELGFHIMLTNRFGINISGGGHFTSNDFLDDRESGGQGDWIYHCGLGFSYSFFGKNPIPVTLPSGISESSYDSDKDGVPDHMDLCPDTPENVKVNSKGCPIDSDADGVPDGIDECANTPKGVKVNGKGCPLDDDEDGVPNYLDKCPDTPAGKKVDKDGCEIEVPLEKVATENPEYDLSKDRLVSLYIYTDGTTYCFQVSAWKEEAEALKEVELLKMKNHNALIHKFNISKAFGLWYRVRIGFFDTEEEARIYLNKNFLPQNIDGGKKYYKTIK